MNIIIFLSRQNTTRLAGPLPHQQTSHIRSSSSSSCLGLCTLHFGTPCTSPQSIRASSMPVRLPHNLSMHKIPMPQLLVESLFSQMILSSSSPQKTLRLSRSVPLPPKNCNSSALTTDKSTLFLLNRHPQIQPFPPLRFSDSSTAKCTPFDCYFGNLLDFNKLSQLNSH